MRKTCITAMVLAILATTLCVVEAKSIYVDNVKGNDANDGSEQKPLRSLQLAVSKLKTSDQLHLTATGKPYSPPLNPMVGGTPEKPLIIDGHGTTISGFRRYGMDEWKDEDNGVFSMPFRNHAIVMNDCWKGYDLVFFSGKPGTNCKSREALVENGYFLQKMARGQKEKRPHDDFLFIRLPAGQTPETIAIETGSPSPNIYINTPNVIVRNLTSEFCNHDGFSTGKNGKNLLFENIEARYNMDQGISNHGAAPVIVKNSRFHHNAGGGAVDVKDVILRYERCIFADDSYRGGLEFLTGKFELIDCIIRGNSHKGLLINRDAEATLKNCLFIAPAKEKTTAVMVGKGSKGAITDCTFWGYDVAVRAATGTTVERCAILKCRTAYQGFGRSPIELKTNDNILDVSVLYEYAGGSKPIPRTQWSGFVKNTGQDQQSALITYTGNTAPDQPITAKTQQGKTIKAGATVPAELR